MITVVPYVNLNGSYTIPEETVIATFHKMVLDGTAQIVFYEGKILNAESFSELLKSPNNYPVFVLVDGVVMAVAWINDLKDNHATAHFCVFREAWGIHSHEMGKEVLKYWFSFKKADGTPMFDVILGVTPSEFKPAIRFISDLGFKIVGEVPKVIYNALTKTRCGAVLSYCERFV